MEFIIHNIFMRVARKMNVERKGTIILAKLNLLHNNTRVFMLAVIVLVRNFNEIHSSHADLCK
jgi:hypothetical protein